MAQHQERKRKESPSCQTGQNHVPPPLSIEVPKMKNLPKESKPWSDVQDQLPVDILLLTVEDCEFLACYAYLHNSIKSYHNNLGHVYFGTMGGRGEEALKVALMRCSKGGPCGSQNVVKNAVIPLRPKAVFLVGCCRGLNPQATKLGDVVVSSKLIIEDFAAPVKKNIGNLILSPSGGWDPPTTAKEVKVHSDSEIFGGINDPVDAKKRRMNAAAKEGEGNILINY